VNGPQARHFTKRPARPPRFYPDAHMMSEKDRSGKIFWEMPPKAQAAMPAFKRGRLRRRTARQLVNFPLPRQLLRRPKSCAEAARKKTKRHRKRSRRVCCSFKAGRFAALRFCEPIYSESNWPPGGLVLPIRGPRLLTATTYLTCAPSATWRTFPFNIRPTNRISINIPLILDNANFVFFPPLSTFAIARPRVIPFFILPDKLQIASATRTARGIKSARQGLLIPIFFPPIRPFNWANHAP